MSQSQAQASCGPAHPTGSAASRHQQNGSGTKQRPAGVHHVLRQSSPPDALRTLSRQRNANRIRRHRGRMQNSGQTTVVLLGNALDPRGRSNHPQPASPRPHRKPVAPVLAKNQPVWCSRPSKTLITGRTHCNSLHYLRASMEGALRLDLTGKPAGTVTATEARHATERLAALAKVAAKRASKVASTPTGGQTSKGAGTESPPAASATPKASNISNRTVATEPTMPGQKRLSLGDLKRA